jgi:predicted methyltransferase
MFRPAPLVLLLTLACSSAAVPPEAPSPGGDHTHGDPAHGDHTHGHQTHGGAGYHKDFSDAEGFAAHFDDPQRDAWQRPDEVLDLLQLAPGNVVADLGAGTGYFVAGLSRRVGSTGRVLALDVEPKMIDFMQRRIGQEKLGNVRAVLVAPDDPGLSPGSVSRVLVVNTWHHLDARASYASKLAAALAPGGEVWVVDFTPESDLGPPPGHRLRAEQVMAELEQGGLHAELVNEGLPKQYVVRATR